MRWAVGILCVGLAVVSSSEAQTRKPAPKPTPRPAKPVLPLPTRQPAEWRCPSELGVGVSTTRRFCDVLTGRDPKDGILITIPPHVGSVTLFFELHNRHTYSAELIAERKAYRKYTATVGVLSLDNTLIDRAVIQSEFRTERDLFDRIVGGAGPGGVKAVAPTGDEFITIPLPDTVQDQVAILGEKLTIVRPDGTDNFTVAGRPIATISNVVLEYRPPPPAPVKKPPVRKKR